MGELSNLYHRMLKDYADFIKATNDQPKKVLVNESAFSQLKERNQITEKDGNWYFEGTPVSQTNNINEAWMVI